MMTGEKNLFVLLVLTVGEEDEEDKENEEDKEDEEDEEYLMTPLVSEVDRSRHFVGARCTKQALFPPHHCPIFRTRKS